MARQIHEEPLRAPELTRATGRRILAALNASPDFQARLEEAQAAQDAGGTLTINANNRDELASTIKNIVEGAEPELGLPHAGMPDAVPAVPELITPEGWDDAEPIEELQNRLGLPTINSARNPRS